MRTETWYVDGHVTIALSRDVALSFARQEARRVRYDVLVERKEAGVTTQAFGVASDGRIWELRLEVAP